MWQLIVLQSDFCHQKKTMKNVFLKCLSLHNTPCPQTKSLGEILICISSLVIGTQEYSWMVSWTGPFSWKGCKRLFKMTQIFKHLWNNTVLLLLNRGDYVFVEVFWGQAAQTSYNRIHKQSWKASSKCRALLETVQQVAALRILLTINSIINYGFHLL